jgi:hypothetical protein
LQDGLVNDLGLIINGPNQVAATYRMATEQLK